jgi:hypothetical protein
LVAFGFCFDPSTFLLLLEFVIARQAGPISKG